MKIFCVVVFFSFFILTCSKNTSPISQNENNIQAKISVDFYLSDSTGIIDSVFIYQKDIFFNYTVYNLTNDTLYFEKTNSGPIVQFRVLLCDSLIGTSDDAFVYTQASIPLKLLPKDSICMTYNWLMQGSYHFPLIPQKYIVKVIPKINFNNTDLSDFLIQHSFAVINKPGILDTRYYLSNWQGIQDSVFNYGEDVFFNYRVINITDDTLDYDRADSGPIAHFRVMFDDSLIGTSDDGFAYAQVIIPAKLVPHDSVLTTYNWLFYPSLSRHSPLVPGQYVAEVWPKMYFPNIWLRDYKTKISFVVSE